MNKNRRKKILNEYKRNELEKLSVSGDKILADFAKSKLGSKSDELSLKSLVGTQDDDLIEIITEKIREVLGCRYKSDPMKYKSADNVIIELNESLRTIYFTGIFEMHVTMGDTGKFLDGATSFELKEVINGYRLLELGEVSENILARRIVDLERNLSDENKIKKRKIEYIREHFTEFVLS